MNQRMERLGWAGIAILLLAGVIVFVMTPPVKTINEVHSGGAPASRQPVDLVPSGTASP